MIAQSIATIRAQLQTLLAEQSAEHPVDLFAVLVLAHQLESQAEMLAKGLEA